MGWLVLVHAMLAWATHGLAVADHTARDHVHRRLVNRDTKDGLIYIDCGVLKSWRDDNESIHYMSDVSYTDTGRNMNISSDLMSSVPKIYHTVRSFPGASKSCYTFKSLQKGNTYLIRAHFMYGNYDGKNSLPVFDVYFGVNYWVRLQLESETRKMMRELIHSPTTGSIDVCLVDIGLGTPFISELDLRPLKNPIYRAPYGSLQTYYRYNIGSSKSSETYSRFSEDGYDRLWISPPSSLSSSWKPLQVDVRKFLSTNSYELPPEVLQTAAKPASGQYSLVFPWIMPNWTAEYYVYWHFVELENLGNNELRQFNIYAGSNFQYGPVTLKYLQPLTVASRGITLTDSSILFSLNKTSSSTYPPILNAVEIYGVIKLPKSSTNQQEVDAITDIKNMYGLMKVWQGDPCLPINYSWDGVSCSYNGDDAPRITSLSLAFRNLTGKLPPPLSKLAFLELLNLSHNGFTGTIPEFLVRMSSLRAIDLSRNNLTGSVPCKLWKRKMSGLLYLSLEDNPNLSTSDPCVHEKTKLIAAVLASSIAFVAITIITIVIVFKWRRKGGFLYKPKTVVIESRNQQFTPSDIVRITNSFQKIIGKGGFGTVYLGFLNDGTKVAVKMLNPSSTSSIKQFHTEAELLTRVHHKNLVSLVGYCNDRETVALVYEYMANGNLQEHLSGKNYNVMPWKGRLQILMDAALGLEYLHVGCTPPIIHRDMKTANILLDEKMHAKVSDFGISRVIDTDSLMQVTTDVVGTHGYLDPEYCSTFKLSDRSDVYSFGVLLLELITGKPAILNIGQEMVHLTKWVKPILESADIHSFVDDRLRADFNANSAWKAVETGMACLNPLGHERPSMSEVVMDIKQCIAMEVDADEGGEGRENSSHDIVYVNVSRPHTW